MNDILPTHNFTEDEIWYYENEWVDPTQDAYESAELVEGTAYLIIEE